MEEYPTKNDLKKIKKWNYQDPEGLIEFLRQIWWMPNWGFKLRGKRILKLELHTGGWSGNEEIIGELRQNFFWLLYWQKSLRGGHYYFRIKRLK